MTGALTTLSYAYCAKNYLASNQASPAKRIDDFTVRVSVKPSKFRELRKEWRNAIIQAGTNCLSFALDRYDLGASHPDIYSDTFKSILSTNQDVGSLLKGAVKSSGFLRIRSHATSPTKAHVIAMATDPNSNGDFHCYRLLKDGWWHKPGIEAVAKLESAQPHEVMDNRFSEFLGYYLLPPKGVNVISTPPSLVVNRMRQQLG